MARRSDIVDIPYAYTVRGVRAHCRNVEDHVLVDTVPVEIPSVSGAEAPIAFRAYNRADGTTRLELRAYDRRPLLKVEGDHDRTIDRRTLKSLLGRAMTENVTWYGCPFALPRSYGTLLAHQYLGEGVRFRSIEADHRERDRGRAVAMASDMLFIDGVLHRRPPEPRWSVEALAANRSTVIRVTSQQDLQKEPFRIDRRDDMLAFARWTGRDIRLVDDVEDAGIVDWRLDDVSDSFESLVLALSSTLADATGEAFMRMPEAFYPTLVEFREAAASQHPDRQRMIDIVTRMRTSIADRPQEADELCKRLRNLSIYPLKRYRQLEGLAPSMAQDVELLGSLRA